MKILLLEDDKNLHASIKAFLEMEGFEVDSAYKSDDVYDLTYEDTFDLYIFDVNVDGDDGFKILNKYRGKNWLEQSDPNIEPGSVLLLMLRHML